MESCFESELHKFNWIRKYFARRRYETGNAPLIYQEERLRKICASESVDELMDAVNAALSERRTNYFVAFLEELGHERSTGGWATYTYHD